MEEKMGTIDQNLSEDLTSSIMNSEIDTEKYGKTYYDPYSTVSEGKGRSVWQRMFGPLKPSSQRSAVISLITSGIGVCVFSYPKAFSLFGYILGTVCIIFAAFCTTVTYWVVAELCAMYPKHKLYSELVNHFLGKFWNKYTSWILILYFLGSLISTTIVFTTFFQEVFGSKIANYLDLPYNDHFKRQITLLVSILLAIPYFIGTVFKRAGIIRYLGFLVVFMVLYVVCITLFQTKDYIIELKPQYEAWGGGSIFDCALHFGVFIFGFDTIHGFHQVYSAMAMPTVRRIKKVGLQVNLILLALFYLFTIFAYLSLGAEMQDRSFDIFPSKRPLSSDPSDIYMTILKCVMMFSLLSSYMVNSIPLKLQIMHHFNLPETELNHIILAAVISLGSVLLAYIYPEITNWFSLLGAVGANSLAVLLPSLCFCKAVEGKSEYKFWTRSVILWATVSTLLSIICLIATCANMLGYHPDW